MGIERDRDLDRHVLTGRRKDGMKALHCRKCGTAIPGTARPYGLFAAAMLSCPVCGAMQGADVIHGGLSCPAES